MDKLISAYEQAIECLGIMGATGATLTKKQLCNEFKKAERGRKMTKAFSKMMEPHIRRQPLKYVMLVHLAMPEDHPFVDKAFASSYEEITGKGTTAAGLRKAVRWYLGREQPVHEPTVVTLPQSEKPEPQGLQPGEALPALPSSFMSDASQVNPPACDQKHHPSPVLVAGAMDNTPTIVGLLDTVGYMESRIKTLEDMNVKTLKDMKEELRSDISDAFDALAAEQPWELGENLSSNPFAAIEQVKALLKEAGFTGTLTLTIE